MGNGTIIATKNGRTKPFSEEVWKLLGTNKQGWVKNSDSVAENTVNKLNVPDSGEKGTATNQVVDNEAEKQRKADAEKAEAAAELANSDKLAAEKSVAQPLTGNETEEELNKIGFLKAITDAGLTKNNIKNYLDSVNEPYQNGDNLTVLSEILFRKLNGDIATLKSTFSI